MTRVYITIDTEYSSGLCRGVGARDREDNFARSVACKTTEGPRGVPYQLALFAEYGIKAVFFVDPMPALVWGVAAIEDVVGPIVEAGQDVQLHCHTEWLAAAGAANPLGIRASGQNLYDFAFEDQLAILDYSRSTLMMAGAPAPVAFRAGNYGANDDTLRALADLGIAYDSSHCPALPGASRITLGPEARDPLHHAGVIEVPVGSIGELGGGQRHAQITALTLAEMRAALRHAREQERESFTLVSHSFELINRRTLAANRIVQRRLEGLCHTIASMKGLASATYASDPPKVAPAASAPSPLLPPSAARTGWRYAEQFASNTLYGAL
ncbi:polysaccharide deacetylase family protein [Erythrobacter sp.]|jgi:hypothetical protein|uniref:polysaccharide deacetylase family protein n=1 Tax=Erythrobacter sp. TaxID=1042 RepID=UPI002EB32853|nr:hypothetical protein [Erythrobacter sp.]